MPSTSSGGVPIALVLVTSGAVLVYSAFKGGSILDVFASDIPEQGKVTPSPDSQPDPPATTPAAPAAPSTGPQPTGTTVIDGHPVANWIAKDVRCARAHGWNGTVTSGVRTYAEQQQACIHVCGNPNGCPGTCAKPGTSNHRGSTYPLGAVDVTDPAGFAVALRACGSRLKNRLPNDRVHYSFTGS